MKRENIIKSLVYSVLLAALLFFLYSGHFEWIAYDEVLLIIPVILVLGGVPYVLTKLLQSILDSSDTGQLIALMVGMLSVIGHGVFFGLWLGRQELKAYEKHGVWTWGVVTRAFQSHGPRMYYSFTANGNYYTSFNVSNPLYLAEGDSVEVIYNSQNPEMNSAKENLDE